LILIVIEVAVPNCFPHVSHLEPYPHHRGPLDVVGLVEGRPPAVGTDVPYNDMDPMVTMVPLRGGSAAPPVKAAISVNPAAGASAAVGGIADTRALARSVAGASAPVRAAATAPLGVRGCPLRRLLPRCLPRQLELVVSVVVGRNRAVGATGAQSLELYRCRTRCICRRCNLCRGSLAFLCRSNLGLLPALRARGDRAQRLSFEHGALVGGCYVGKRLPQTSCCSSVQERRDDLGQSVFLLAAENRGRRGKGMSRRYLGCRIEWL
jgi:hypothetical protein